jgi:hypothetical protein
MWPFSCNEQRKDRLQEVRQSRCANPRMRKVATAGIAILALGLITTVMVSRGSTGADRYPDGESLYAALREQPHTMLSACGGDIEVVFADGAPGLDRERVMEWIRRSTWAVSTYFGQFPVRQVGLLVIADDCTRCRDADSCAFEPLRSHAQLTCADRCGGPFSTAGRHRAQWRHRIR